MNTQKDIFILAFYLFVPIGSPEEEVKRHKDFFMGRDASARIYISYEGINGQMSAAKEDALAYMDWMHQDPRFKEVEFKIHYSDSHVFPRLTIKAKKQLVALDIEVDTKEGGVHISPALWKQMLEEKDENTLVLDVRNNYEWKIGHFEEATLPNIETFREFPEYARRLKETKDPKKTKVMMYCTGGIRCELYSALLKKEGFDEVYQLQGGVIKYGLEYGAQHWKGKLFVFDDRIAVPLDSKQDEPISKCCFCSSASDVYYNCANMDCNELFISCSACASSHQGCCSKACEQGRIRPFDATLNPKPFRRKHLCGLS